MSESIGPIGRAAWCALGEAGAIEGEGLIPADEDGLARLVLELGTEVEACVEMMSGAIWVKDQLELAGWQVKVAHARKVSDIAPLACKTDKVDARVLAELCRRDLVPEVWVASLEDRAIRERLRRRAHLVKAAHLGSQPDLRPADPVRPADLLHAAAPARRDRAARAPRRARGLARLDRRAPRARSTSSTGGSTRSTASWRRSRAPTPRAQLLADDPRRRAADQPHLRRRDRRRLALLVALEAGRLRRPGAADQPVGRALGDRARSRRPARGRLRWAAVEAANQAWRPTNPFHEHYRRLAARHGKNPAKSAVARKLLIAAWHMLSRRPGLPTHPTNTAPASSSRFLAA